MKSAASTLLCAALFCAPSLFGMQGSTPPTNSQDVPKQEPSTNNPDVGKQRKPTTTPKDTTTNKEDVPEQQPGTNNPDVGKQRHTTDTSGAGKGNTSGKKSKTKKSDTSSTSSQ